MENRINVAELLKDCPQDIELNCVLFEQPVKYIGLAKSGTYIITIKAASGEVFYLTKEGYLYDIASSKCIIFPKGKTTWEGFVPPCKFKDGDIAYTCCDDGDEYIFIFKNITNNKCVNSYLHLKGDELRIINVWLTNCDDKQLRFATKEEKEKLFKAIKDNGYKWNTNTKTLEKLIEPKFKVGDKIRHKTINKNYIYEINKIYDDSYGLVGLTWMLHMKYQDDYELVPNKFDISTLVPFESKVLGRDNDQQKWYPAIWGYYDDNSRYPYAVIGDRFKYCIPYKNNEHLLGTTDDCNDFYKTW
jgi:hypothetical protein